MVTEQCMHLQRQSSTGTILVLIQTSVKPVLSSLHVLSDR